MQNDRDEADADVAGRRSGARQKAERLLLDVRRRPYPGSAVLAQWADDIRALAVLSGDRLLEARSLLLPGRSLLPTVRPMRTLAAMARAGAIFRAHGQMDDAVHCDVVAARAVYDLGCEQEAIRRLVQAAAAAEARTDTRAGAQMTQALCLGHLGMLDDALGLLTGHVLPLAERCGDEFLLAQARRAHALMLLQVVINHRQPGLWRGLPGLPPLRVAMPAPADVVAAFDQAEAVLPPGAQLAFIDMGRAVARLLAGPDGRAGEVLVEIETVVRRQAGIDPPMAAWSLFCKALIEAAVGATEACLATLKRARDIAATCQLDGLLRDVLRLQARLLEASGDIAQALACQKQLADLQLRSLMFGLVTPPARAADEGPTGRPDEAAGHAAPVRALEPVHVRRAVQFIDNAQGTGVSVADIVAHCEVGRRTLEMAFKACRGTTLAGYIRRRRLERAVRLMSQTEASLGEIASLIGYRSHGAFAREFRAQYGVSPSVWARSRAAEAALGVLRPDSLPPGQGGG